MRILFVNPRIWIIVYCFTFLFENKFLFIWAYRILKFLLICALFDILRIVFQGIKRWSMDDDKDFFLFLFKLKSKLKWKKKIMYSYMIIYDHIVFMYHHIHHSLYNNFIIVYNHIVSMYRQNYNSILTFHCGTMILLHPLSAHVTSKN